ncbi:hypothetical protein [Bradyrhizobium lablabi]|uniref:hypothetical protein n=1 Tax=Bradyrhizobium lablabi TaxID=722472 RepID=UPI0012ABA032|nr:hypothetical protein [Bradyrhizobium lablabi]
MRRAKVLLHWLVTGQLDVSPRGSHFSLPARFDHQGDDWMDNAWSLVVDLDGSPDSHRNQVGTVGFLMPEAPNDWLREGKRFILMEGPLALAEGEITQVRTD